jgi:hypothetical protein
MSVPVLEAGSNSSIALRPFHSRINQGPWANTRSKYDGFGDEVYNESERLTVYQFGTFCIYCGFRVDFHPCHVNEAEMRYLSRNNSIAGAKTGWVMATGIFFVFAQIVICVLLPAFIMGGVKSVGICLRHQRESRNGCRSDDATLRSVCMFISKRDEREMVGTHVENDTPDRLKYVEDSG